jgi:hypothetical protein
MESECDLRGVVCMVEGSGCGEPPFGWMLGLGCHTELKLAMEIAALSVARNVAAILGKSGLSPISIEEFLSLSSPGPLHHSKGMPNESTIGQIKSSTKYG